jgi:hypothetical protein
VNSTLAARGAAGIALALACVATMTTKATPQPPRTIAVASGTLTLNRIFIHRCYADAAA